MHNGKALVVVDLQVDFCSGGALAVRGGDSVVPVLNRYIDAFTSRGLPVYATRDWHPKVTRHFKDFGGSWPVHCVRGTAGAEFHPNLKLPRGTTVITCGELPDEEGYSAFEGHGPGGIGLSEILNKAGVGHLYIGGLATDYCVRATLLDAAKEGFACTLLIDAVRGVDVETGDSERAAAEMKDAGANIISFDDLNID